MRQCEAVYQAGTVAHSASDSESGHCRRVASRVDHLCDLQRSDAVQVCCVRKGEGAMTDLEITEQTLWCVLAAKDEQCPCDGSCPNPCDKPSHINPSDELVRFWQDQVLHHKELENSNR